MIHQFLKTHRAELISRCRAKAVKRNRTTVPESAHGVPQFLTQLIETFRVEQTPEARAHHRSLGPGRPSLALVPTDIAGTASLHGEELRRQGATIDQVVHDYGDLCQALTELALEREATISVDEFHTFNRCLDDAIADAVSAYSRVGIPAEQPRPATSPKPRFLIEEIRAVLDVATHSFAAIKSGDVGLKGTTSALHEKCLADLTRLVETFQNGRSHGDPADRDASAGNGVVDKGHSS
jgi:hypothetical protein